MFGHLMRLEFVLAFGVEKLPCAIVFGFVNEDVGLGGKVIGIGFGIEEFVASLDAMLFKHHDQKLGFDDVTCKKLFHWAAAGEC